MPPPETITIQTVCWYESFFIPISHAPLQVNNMKIKKLLVTLCASLILTSVSGIAKEVKIGMAIDDLRLERWHKDRDIFVKKEE